LEDVIVAPLVRDCHGSDLLILDDQELRCSFKSFVYLAPGEDVSEQHMKRLEGGWVTGVSLG
jgi:hypothetical protein